MRAGVAHDFFDVAGDLPDFFWISILFFSEMCIYTFEFLIIPFKAFQGLWLFVQSQRGSFEIREDGGPAVFTKSFDCGALGGLPSWRKFLNLFLAFGRNCQFDTIAVSSADGLHETIPLQWTEISHKRRAFHAQPIAQFGHAPIFLGIQRQQNSPLRWTDSVPPHLRVIKLRHRPRHPSQIEAHAVFYRRHVQFF